MSHIHRIYRNPAAPWLALRVSKHSSDCYRSHTHAEYSVGIVDAGEAIFHHPGGPERVGPGTVVLIEPEVMHACNPVPQSTWSYRMLFVAPDWLHGQVQAHCVLGTAAPMHFCARALRDPALSEWVDRLCTPSAIQADAAQQCGQIGRMLSPHLQPGVAGDQAPYPLSLAPAMRQIQGALHGGVTVRELAHCCGMSASQFTRRFTHAMGVAPAHYLQNLRVNGARRLLACGVSLAESAHAMGFSDQAHMQRAFKARHAMTPGRYADGMASGF